MMPYELLPISLRFQSSFDKTMTAEVPESDAVLPRFNDRADSYAQAAVVQRSLAVWLAEWLEPIEQTRRLTALELGPGNGLFTRVLAPRFDCLTAVDDAPRMVEQGRCALPEVEWEVGDAWQIERLPADRVYSASLLQWCDEPMPVLSRWLSLAKTGVRMLHGFYVAPTLDEWQTIAQSQSPVRWRSSEEWIACFREAGWNVLRSESRSHVHRFPSALELVRFFHRTGATTARQTSAGGLRKMISAYDNRFPAADGTPGVRSMWTFFRIEVAK